MFHKHHLRGKPGKKTYQELIAALRAVFSPTPSPIMCRLKFHHRCHQPDECISVFFSQLCSLSENCGFVNTLIRGHVVRSTSVWNLQQWNLEAPPGTGSHSL